MHYKLTAENRLCIMIDYSIIIDKRQINSFEFSTFFFGKRKYSKEKKIVI